MKIAGVVALIGAAVGGGLAIGMGLRLFATIALAGIGTGVALGVIAGEHRPRRVNGAETPPLLI